MCSAAWQLDQKEHSGANFPFGGLQPQILYINTLPQPKTDLHCISSLGVLIGET